MFIFCSNLNNAFSSFIEYFFVFFNFFYSHHFYQLGFYNIFEYVADYRVLC